ncbi:helix-turn-helix domain-containing protein [Ectothiorhodospiraceae bacterium WFHF3C12]|nr:helix-turn-helix domain-containing protein [Ectothiorhodospiraceae bacterium WFHF3C12]
MPHSQQIGLLLYPDCMPAGLLAFADLLHAANRRLGKRVFTTTRVGLATGPVACANGLTLEATHGLETADLDAVLVPGFWAESPAQVEQSLTVNHKLIAALARAGRKTPLWAYCTGVCLLAAGGALDGRAATVTWWLTDALVREHPAVTWRPEREHVADGGTVTASGVHGYLPIAQRLLEEQISPSVFNDVSRLMVLPRPLQPHEAFGSISPVQQPGKLVRAVHRWVEEQPAERITMPRLAAALKVSERTLARRVKAESGMSPAAYARRIKLYQVAERLTLTSATLGSIGAALGFSSESNLSRMFKQLTGLTPVQYRQRYSRQQF